MIPAHFLFLTLKILFSLCFVVGIISQVYKRGVVIVGVVSLTMGNSGLIAGHGLPGQSYLLGHLFLGHPAIQPKLPQSFADFSHENHPALSSTGYRKSGPKVKQHFVARRDIKADPYVSRPIF